MIVWADITIFTNYYVRIKYLIFILIMSINACIFLHYSIITYGYIF